MSSGTGTRPRDAAERLVDELARSRRGNSRFTPAKVAAVVVATPVHLATLVALALGLALLWPGTSLWHKLLGLLCLALVYGLRPQLRRDPKGPGLMAGVHTAALIRDVAEAVGSPVPSRCQVGMEINAYAVLSGMRRRVLTLGAPLWTALAGPERVALLGHELGHFANADPLQGKYVGTARETLGHWAHMFEAGSQARAAQHTPLGFPALIASWLLHLPRMAVLGYRRLLELVAAPSSRRQEHYADLASVRAGGTAGAVGLLEVLLASHGIDVAANRAAVTRTDLADAIREQMASYDAERRAAIRRAGDVEERRSDSTHPPTMQRLRLVESAGAVDPAVVRSAAEWALIDAEFSAAVTSQLAKLGERYRYVR